MNKLQYPARPIRSVRPLARALETRQGELQRLALAAPELYPLSHSKGIELKPDGSARIFYAPRPPIRNLQRRIHDSILLRVTFPDYLIAGLKHHSYRDNCLLHLGARTVINLDVSTFFESILSEHILGIWRDFFGFNSEVSALLTRLTTHNDALPRGAPTSPLLANLVFWDLEPQLHAELARLGIRYSRYVDDVSLSSKERLDEKTIGYAIRRVLRMFRSKGLRLNDNKTRVRHAPNALKVHNVNVHGTAPTLPKEVRRRIRAEVQGFVAGERAAVSRADRLREYRRVTGRLSWLNQFHPKEARALWAKLRASPNQV